MKNREKVKQLNDSMYREIERVKKLYMPEIISLYYKFRVSELINNGWTYRGLYPAGGKNAYFFENDETVWVILDDEDGDGINHVFTYNGYKQRNICDMDDLEYYNETGE